jgi:hypothetical protein
MIAGRNVPIFENRFFMSERSIQTQMTKEIFKISMAINISAWKTLGASYKRPSPGDIAVRNRRKTQTKTAVRELGKMVRGF